jgi:PAS domain S-box-containing protein
MDAVHTGDDVTAIYPGPGFAMQEVAESLREAFFLLDRMGTFVYVCPLLAELAGTSPEWLTGKNLSDLLPQDKVEHFLSLRERLLADEALQVEWELQRGGAEPVYLRIYLTPWKREDEIVGAVGLAWDITESLLGEREMEKKALLLRLQMDVLEHLAKADGVTEVLRVIVDKACEALGMDSCCLAALYRSERGWLARQIIQTRWPLSEVKVTQWKELPSRKISEALKAMDIFTLREGEGPVEWLWAMDHKLALVTPILSSPRGAFVLILVSTDERESRELEHEFLNGLVSIAGQALERAELMGSLRQSEESYINLADSVVEAVAIVEAEKVIFANQSMANLMGFATPGEMKGARLEELVLPDSLREVRLQFARGGLTPGRMRLNLRRRQGQEFTTDVLISSLPYSSRRAYQVMIKGTEGFEGDIQVTPYDFLSRFSHDFRTPLVSVSGFADILEKLVDSEDSRTQECLGGIKRGMSRLSRMVDNMLVLARTQAVTQEGSASSGQVLRDVLEDLREDIQGESVETAIPPDIPEVPIPEGELQEIFQNLISNAVRAVRGVEHPRLVVRYKCLNGYHLFSVEDNGVGIPEEHHESIFQPLFRLVSGEEGSGLGLSIVRQILRAHGGDVWVKSSPGVGTSFFFSIPAQ